MPPHFTSSPVAAHRFPGNSTDPVYFTADVIFLNIFNRRRQWLLPCPHQPNHHLLPSFLHIRGRGGGLGQVIHLLPNDEGWVDQEEERKMRSASVCFLGAKANVAKMLIHIVFIIVVRLFAYTHLLCVTSQPRVPLAKQAR